MKNLFDESDKGAMMYLKLLKVFERAALRHGRCFRTNVIVKVESNWRHILFGSSKCVAVLFDALALNYASYGLYYICATCHSHCPESWDWFMVKCDYRNYIHVTKETICIYAGILCEMLWIWHIVAGIRCNMPYGQYNVRPFGWTGQRKCRNTTDHQTGIINFVTGRIKPLTYSK